MSIKYLLDTNIISEPLRPTPNQRILEKLQLHQSEIAIATVVWHELWFGCYRLPLSARRTAIERYLTEIVSVTMPILPYNQTAAEWHATERSRLTSAGRTPPFADGQIAATAYANNLTLVTLNHADYMLFQGIQIESWSDVVPPSGG